MFLKRDELVENAIVVVRSHADDYDGGLITWFLFLARHILKDSVFLREYAYKL